LLDDGRIRSRFRTVESWNKLPERVKTAETGESFKRRLRGKPE
jgi:hypothetical protein